MFINWRLLMGEADEVFVSCNLMAAKGFMGVSLSPTESRNRSIGTTYASHLPHSLFPLRFAEEDKSKTKSQKWRDVRELNKYHSLLSERNPGVKVHFLKVVLFLTTCFTVFTLFFSPAISKEQKPQSNSRSRFVDVEWLWRRASQDARYLSSSDVQWDELSHMLGDAYGKQEDIKIGLLNFNFSDIRHWKQTFPDKEISVVHLDYADPGITWKVLYPEWIDQEAENEVPACPSLPEPRIRKGARFDLVAVKLPCNASGSWSRDVARLHLQLAAAKLAADSAVGHRSAHVLLITDCHPTPNLFTCKDLVRREGNAWLYRPDAMRLQDKLRLPTGSCELAIPLEAKVRSYTEVGSREAYATVLHSAEKYVCGAIAVAQSIRLAGSTRDLVILVDETVSRRHRDALQAAGWKLRTMERIRNPKAKRDAYNEWNYSKFRLWQLTDYDKVVFVDADLLILRNIDFLFALPEISATGNDGTLFNSGVMVVEPSNCTFELLMERIDEITSYNGGDQGYLNEIFTWWHRIPKNMNYLKHFWYGEDETVRAKKAALFGAEPPVLYVLHYLGLKPWLCFRDYDCNWNMREFRDFASDEAHATWWRVHDAMPEHLRSFCYLSTLEKAGLEYSRQKAKEGNYADGHWRRKVTDPRLHICTEKFCSWKTMLLHWDQSNSSSKAL